MKSRTMTLVAAVTASTFCANDEAALAQQSSSVTINASQQNVDDRDKYSVINLGTLGGATSGGSSINNRGWVAGFSNLAGNAAQHAALWRGSLKLDLGTLGGSNSAVEWPVKNDRGAVAGISETATKDPLGETFSCAAFIATNGHTCLGFIWRDGVMMALPTLGGNNSYATGMNNWMQVVGWAETATHDPTCVAPQVLQFEAVVWEAENGRVRQLPPLPHDSDGAATAINDRGEAVGISGICDQSVGRFTAAHAVVWTNGRTTDIGNFGGVAWNTPTAINNRGQIVGFADLPGDDKGTFNPHAFLWTKRRGIRDLGTLQGDTNSQALGINIWGQVVGVSYNKTSSRAFIWQNGVMTDLNALKKSRSSPFLVYANDINDRGEIVGAACRVRQPNCATFAFKAIPQHD